MRKPNKNKMAGVNSHELRGQLNRFEWFPSELPVYILKQLFFSISVNSGRIFTEPRAIHLDFKE